jgi:predicted DCC family thiol-disulfide oxidoreductase YuxK
MLMPKPEQVTVYYDGDCFFCQNYASYIALKDASCRLALKSLAEPAVQQELQEPLEARTIVWNQGMIVQVDAAYYQGAPALFVLSQLSRPNGLLNGIITLMFQHQWLGKIAYPVLYQFRQFFVWLKKAAR